MEIVNGDSYDKASSQIKIHKPVVVAVNKDVFDVETSIVEKGEYLEPESFFVDISAPQNSTESIIKTEEITGDVVIEKTEKSKPITNSFVQNTPVNKNEIVKKNEKIVSKTKPNELLMPIFLAPRWPRLL